MNVADATSDNACQPVKFELPDTTPKAIVIMAHGLGEHSGCFAHWAQLFVNNNFGVALFDWHGHGLAAGKRGHASLNILKNDLQNVIMHVRQSHPDKPIFLYAHSMGALVALSSIADGKLKINGVIAASPWLELRMRIPRTLLGAARLLALVWPSLTVKTGLKPEQLSALGSSKSTKTDPLLHKRISLRLFTDLWNEGRRLTRTGLQTDIPLLIMYGQADRLMQTQAVKLFNENSKTLNIISWPETGHDLHHEILYLDVFQYVNEWILSELR